MDTRLVFLSRSPQGPSSFQDVDDAQLIVRQGELVAHIPAEPFKGRTILIVPGTEVLTRWLELDDASPAGAAQQAAILLKDEIGAPRDRIHLALGSLEDDGARLVCVIDRGLMREFLDRARELGISPEIVIPDHLMLPPPRNGMLTVAREDIVIVRGDRLAFSAEAELASILIGAQRSTSIDHDDDAERVFVEGSRAIAINLLQQDFALAGRRAAWGGLRRSAALAAITALSPLVIWTAEIARNEGAARALEARSLQTAHTVLGNEVWPNPILELRSRAGALRASDEFIRSTAMLFERMASVDGLELESLSYLDEGIIRATLVHAAAFDVNGLSDALKQSGLTVDQDAAVERDGRTVTTITLRSRS